MSNSTINEQKRCIICKQVFMPHPKVKSRQKACSRFECQRIRQKINQIQWQMRNPPDYRRWYQDYGKFWRLKNLDYHRQYRQKRCLINIKRKELTYKESINYNRTLPEKRKELMNCYYLVNGKGITITPIIFEKKEELSYCFCDLQ